MTTAQAHKDAKCEVDKMKKALVIGGFILAICLSFLAGSSFREKEYAKRDAQRCNVMISFAVGNLDHLKKQYDADEMEVLISNIYAAEEYASDSELAGALHELWNALIFDGENITGNEDALIKALQDRNGNAVKDIAFEMRTIK